MAFNYKLAGAEAVIGKLRKNVTKEDVKQVVKHNTAEMTRNAQRFAPVDTGALKNSIIMNVKDFQGETNVGVHYGGYVNWGTRNMAPRPYLSNSFDLQVGMFRKEMQMLVK